jgi:hypothetical protein
VGPHTAPSVRPVQRPHSLQPDRCRLSSIDSVCRRVGPTPPLALEIIQRPARSDLEVQKHFLRGSVRIEHYVHMACADMRGH